MPVGIGIGHTKTLAKAAQHASKVYRKQTGGVVDLRADHAVKWLLERMPCKDVWGVGRRLTDHLGSDGITTAWQLANAHPESIRRRYGVVLERTVRELQGQSCLDLQEAEPDRQTICTSRMFGSRITTKSSMQAAIASYMHRAAQKLRNQKSLTSVFRLGIRTSPFGDEPKYSNATTVIPPFPTDDVLLLTRLASKALDDIWKDGFRYSKAEILLMDLMKRGEYTEDPFTPSLGKVRCINAHHGSGKPTIRKECLAFRKDAYGGRMGNAARANEPVIHNIHSPTYALFCKLAPVVSFTNSTCQVAVTAGCSRYAAQRYW